MKVKLTRNHPSEWHHIIFPTFAKGTPVKMVKDKEEGDDYFKDWLKVKIDGYETFVPISFVADGKLTREYNPTELVQKQGDIVEVIEIVNAWLLCKNEKEQIGWIPAEIAVSIE